MTVEYRSNVCMIAFHTIKICFAASCEHGNEPSGCIKGKLLDQLGDC
jgi:hypothetical protein